MANIIKVKRGLSTDLAKVSLQAGEMAYTTDTKKLYISTTDKPINNDTTYTLTKSGSTITLTGSDGSTTSVTDSNTTYTIDSALSSTSTNPIQNKVVNTALNNKANKATTLAGYGITNAYTKAEIDDMIIDCGSLRGAISGGSND